MGMGICVFQENVNKTQNNFFWTYLALVDIFCGIFYFCRTHLALSDSGVAKRARGAMAPKLLLNVFSPINLCCYVILVCDH